MFDKGRSPGGRLATRRIDGARVDHGAQFFTVRSDEFAALRARSGSAAGLVREWCRGFSAEGDGYPRYVARGGMNALAKHLAAGLDVRCNSLVFSLHRDERARTVERQARRRHDHGARRAWWSRARCRRPSRC